MFLDGALTVAWAALKVFLREVTFCRTHCLVCRVFLFCLLVVCSKRSLATPAEINVVSDAFTQHTTSGSCENRHTYTQHRRQHQLHTCVSKRLYCCCGCKEGSGVLGGGEVSLEPTIVPLLPFGLQQTTTIAMTPRQRATNKTKRGKVHFAWKAKWRTA